MTGLLTPEFWFFVGSTAGIYTIFALGLQLEFGFTGLLNFGHVAFMAVGGYTMAILVVNGGLNLWLAAILAILATVPFSLLIGLPTLRLRSDYLAMTTLAFAEIVRYVAVNEQGLTGGAQGTINLAGVGQAANYNQQWLSFQTWVQDLLRGPLGGLATRDLAMLVIVWTVALALIAAVRFAIRSPWGRVLKGIREDEDAVAALGKNTFWYKQQSLVAGGMLGAVAGLFHAFQFSFFSPADFVPLITFFAWMIVILGGTGRAWAVPVGAIIFAVLFAGTRFLAIPPLTLLDSDGRAYARMIIIGLTLILLMRFRPEGVLGRREEMVLE